MPNIGPTVFWPIAGRNELTASAWVSNYSVFVAQGVGAQAILYTDQRWEDLLGWCIIDPPQYLSQPDKSCSEV